MYQDRGAIWGESSEVGYHIIGQIHDRKFELLEQNIDVSIDWESETNEIFKIYIIIIILILTSILFYYFHHINKG